MELLKAISMRDDFDSRAHQYLVECSLIQDSICIHCGHLTTTVQQPNETSVIYKYKCRNCGRRYNTFTGTFFEGGRLRISHLLFLMYLFLNKYTIDQAHNLIRDLMPTKLSKNSIRSFYSKLRSLVCMKIKHEVDQCVLQGPVEIDECLLFKSKQG